jgi:transcriptional regulator with XRE-family HTH domain
MTPPPTAQPTVGARIQARRLLRGWSIRYAASRAGISHTTWSRIERGLIAADNRFMLAGLATALECSPAELAGVPVPATDRAAVAAHAAVHAIRLSLVDLDLSAPPPPSPSIPPTPSDPPAPSAPATPSGPPAHSTPATPSGPPARSTQASHSRPATPSGPTAHSGPPAHPLPAALPEMSRALELLDALRQACDYAGAARLIPGLLRDLHAATAGPDRATALRRLCDVTFIASSVLRNLGHPADAWLGAERCHDAAIRTGDPVLLGYAAYARAGAATACGAFGRGLTLASRAVDDLSAVGRDIPGRLAMLGSLQLICAYATRGLDRLDDSRAWSAESAALAAHTGETTTMGLYFGPTNVGIWRIGIEVDGGDPGRAAEIARTVDPNVIPAGFRQVFFYADTARALARLRGRDQDAIRFLLIAERVAPQHVYTSALARETSRALLDRSRRAAGGPALRGLCERLQIA